MASPLSDLLATLPGPIPFADFTVRARAAGLRPEGWLGEKHAGKLHTWITTDGVLMIGMPQAAPQAAPQTRQQNTR